MFKKTLIFLFLVILFFNGCARGPAKPRQVTLSPGLYEDTETIILVDRKLRHWLYLVDESVTRTDDGRLVAKAKFMNKWKKPINVQVQTLFKDINGDVVDETNWELIRIPGYSYYYHEASSLNGKANRYTFRCKLPE